MFKLNDALCTRHPVCPGVGLIHMIQHFKDPFRTGQCRLDLAVQLCQLIDGPGKLFGINDERGDHAYRDGAPDDEDRPEYRHQHKGHIVEHVHHRPHGIADDLCDDSCFRQVIGGLREFPHRFFLLIVRCHRSVEVDFLHHDPIDRSQQFLLPQIIFADTFGNDPREQHGEDDDGAGDQGQLPGIDQHDREGSHQHEHAGAQGAERRGHNVGNVLRVVGHAAHQVPVGMVVQIGDRQAQHLSEEIAAHPFDDPLAEMGTDVFLQQRKRAVEQVHDDHQNKKTRKGIKLFRGDAVDGAALQRRSDDGSGGSHRHADEQDHEPSGLRPEISDQASERPASVLCLFHRCPQITGSSPAESRLRCIVRSMVGSAHSAAPPIFT